MRVNESRNHCLEKNKYGDKQVVSTAALSVAAIRIIITIGACSPSSLPPPARSSLAVNPKWTFYLRLSKTISLLNFPYTLSGSDLNYTSASSIDSAGRAHCLRFQKPSFGLYLGTFMCLRAMFVLRLFFTEEIIISYVINIICTITRLGLQLK